MLTLDINTKLLPMLWSKLNPNLLLIAQLHITKHYFTAKAGPSPKIP
jgi:hypothetical protein